MCRRAVGGTAESFVKGARSSVSRGLTLNQLGCNCIDTSRGQTEESQDGADSLDRLESTKSKTFEYLYVEGLEVK